MPSAISALYEPLIERDLDAIPRAVSRFLESEGEDELWVAVTRFAILAYAPSQHAKRAVMACRAAYDVRPELGERWTTLLVRCAQYAARSRPPWSEPPILEPPEAGEDAGSLESVLAAKDQNAAERWLAAHLDDADALLRPVVDGDALLMLDTASALLPLLGVKGRYALLRMVLVELLTEVEPVHGTLRELVERAVREKGAVDAVRAAFVAAARESGAWREVPHALALAPYDLARDFAQTLIAHAVVRRLTAECDAAGLLAAVHWNLEHGENFGDWSFA